MTVKEIIIEYLKVHGYDGLLNSDCDCNCNLETDTILGCAGDNFGDCIPSKKAIAQEDSEFYEKGDTIYVPAEDTP